MVYNSEVAVAEKCIILLQMQLPGDDPSSEGDGLPSMQVTGRRTS